jgi:hypothetical protein
MRRAAEDALKLNFDVGSRVDTERMQWCNMVRAESVRRPRPRPELN